LDSNQANTGVRGSSPSFPENSDAVRPIFTVEEQRDLDTSRITSMLRDRIDREANPVGETGVGQIRARLSGFSDTIVA
jgi:hypothetical protein